MTDQQRTLSQNGGTVGDSNVQTVPNQPNRNTPAINWTCPSKFDSIEYNGAQHALYAELRTKETFTGTTGDDTYYSLASEISPPAGETTIADMDFEPVQVFNVTQGAVIDVADYDFANDAVVLATDPASGDDVAVFPVLETGTFQFVGVDQFDNLVASMTDFGVELRNFTDVHQHKAGTKIHLDGSIEFEENETLSVHVESPHSIVWQDPEYVFGEWASSFEIETTASY